MNLNSHCPDSLIVILVYFLTFVIHSKCNGSYPALTFDQNSHAMISIRGKIRKGEIEIKDPIALACPAETNEELTFNSKSFGKNSLFVKEVHTSGEKLEDIPYKRCKKPYKLSICHQKSPAEFLFGYEIYVDDLSYPEIKAENYDNFDYVANFFSLLPITKKPKPKLQLEKGKPLKLIWISSFRMIFDNRRSRPKQVIYTVSKGTETGITCADYDLGQEIYEIKKINLDWAYEFQSWEYKTVKMPNFINEPQTKACTPEKQCLTKGSLIPPEEFRFRYPQPKSISCSEATTVPIWKSIVEDVLYKLDRFLYALAKVVHSDLQVIAGVHGKLQMPVDPVNQTTKTIRLGYRRNITVPYAIYKIVKLNVLIPDPNSDDGSLIEATKAIIIVIINDPYFAPTRAFCEMENCAKWGWQEILHRHVPSTGSASKYVFCCARTKQTLEQLGMKLDDKKNKLIDLTYFPVLDAESGKVTYKSIEQDVVKEMEKLFGEKSNYNRAREELEDDFYSSENEENKYETGFDTGELFTLSFGSAGSNDEIENIDEIPVPRISFFRSKEDSTEGEKHQWEFANEKTAP